MFSTIKQPTTFLGIFFKVFKADGVEGVEVFASRRLFIHGSKDLMQGEVFFSKVFLSEFEKVFLFFRKEFEGRVDQKCGLGVADEGF